MQQKRTGKFYRQNEREVMEQLGIKPTKNSGSGWIEKEDGIGDLTMVQLKSTDAQQITIKQKDIRILEQHASESHKAPVFAIQFLNTGEIWLMAKQEDLIDVAVEIGVKKAIYAPNGLTEEQEKEFVEGIKNNARWEISRCPSEPVFGDLSRLSDTDNQIIAESLETPPEASQSVTEGISRVSGSSAEGRREFYSEYERKKR